jgi:hypothetical protein
MWSAQIKLILFFTTRKIPQLLCRMQNGALALPTPSPRVWWVLIGINDSLSGGLLRIIQELQLPQP